MESNTAVVTFSSLLRIRNELFETIELTVIDKIPTVFGEESAALHGLSSSSLRLGKAQSFAPGTTTVLPLITRSGAVVIHIAGYTSTPILSLLERQQTVFRVQSQEGYTLLALEVIDDSTGFLGIIRQPPFPTPIMIANCLSDVTISAFQLVSARPFKIEPLSTSVFAFDEPAAYPSAVIAFGDCRFNISLVEDTQPILMDEAYMRRPIFVEIKHNIRGQRIVFVNDMPLAPELTLSTELHLEIERVSISIIDQAMREFMLLVLTKVESASIFKDPHLSMRFSLGTLQLDDQNPLAVCQTIVFGRGPQFLLVECLWPSDGPWTLIDFLSVTLQRIDIDIDAALIADLIGLLASLGIESRPDEIAPVKAAPAERAQLVTARWLEVSPLSLVITFRGRTRRPAVYSRVPGYFAFVPKLKAGRLLLPGVVLAQVTDRVDSLASKISGDYLSELFHQCVRMLGKRGRFLSSVGVTSRIASALKISLTTDMQAEVARFARPQQDRFDNRHEIAGCFSSDALTTLAGALRSRGLRATPTVAGLLQRPPSCAGLKTKTVAGYGYGHGVAGILTRPPADAEEAAPGAGRARTPRAFPRNRIEEYDRSVAGAQTAIAKRLEGRERIRMAAPSANGGPLVCLTDTCVVCMAREAEVRAVVRIAEIEGVAIVGRKVTLRGPGPAVTIEVDDTKLAEQIMWYVTAQSRMLLRFKESLLV
jgi:hypothetical protein